MIPSFTEVLNVSITASWLVLAVAAMHLVLRKAPKRLHCALWSLVAVRLLLPFSIESPHSLIPSVQTVPESYLFAEGTPLGEPARLEIVENPALGEDVTVALDTTVDQVQLWDLRMSLVWLFGMGLMGIYAMYSYLHLRLRLRYAAPAGEGYYVCDDISMPFILGLLRPKIYLPSAMDSASVIHVLAHERAHLKRLDYVWKPLGYGLLTVHWFNPVMWLAYWLLCRDIELACDEQVIRDMDRASVRAYSEALVLCSAPGRWIAACPLAFGEVGVAGRVKAMLSYKKPGFWVLAMAVVASVFVTFSFLTDPAEAKPALDRICKEKDSRITVQTERDIHVMLYKDWLPEDVLNGYEHAFRPGEIPVYERENTTLSLMFARLSGTDLLLTFAFSYDLPASGTITLPFSVVDGEREWALNCTGVHDFVTDYPDAAYVAIYGKEAQFSVRLNMEVYKTAEDYVAFTLEGMNDLTYVSEDTDITPLMGAYYNVEKVLYSHPDYGYEESDVPEYLVGADLTLSSRVEGPEDEHWATVGTLGTLSPVDLDGGWFEALFRNEHWQSQDESAVNLRRMNQSAWRCDTDSTSPPVSHLLLHQKNGAVYMAVLAEQGSVLTQLFRLERGDACEETELLYRRYLMESEEEPPHPTLQLCSDRTFTYTESVFSSYLYYGSYTFSGRELVLKTSDDRYTWYFAQEEDRLIFDAERSDPMRFARIGQDYKDIPDGARFRLLETYASGAFSPTTSIDLDLPESYEVACMLE